MSTSGELDNEHMVLWCTDNSLDKYPSNAVSKLHKTYLFLHQVTNFVLNKHNSLFYGVQNLRGGWLIYLIICRRHFSQGPRDEQIETKLTKTRDSHRHLKTSRASQPEIVPNSFIPVTVSILIVFGIIQWLNHTIKANYRLRRLFNLFNF